MHKSIFFLILSLHFTTGLSAQEDPKELSGNYYAEGFTDGTKSGFYLNSNYSFNFFYSKNGIDRHGSGKWHFEKNTIVLNGRMKPARIFRLESSRRVNDNFVTVTFTDDKPELVNNIECILFTEKGRQKLFTKENGVVKFNKQTVDSIQIRSALFPDHPFTYICTNKLQNSFEFSFDKAIYEVFFDNFSLLFTKSMLAGRHPLLKGQFRYLKDNE